MGEYDRSYLGGYGSYRGWLRLIEGSRICMYDYLPLSPSQSFFFLFQGLRV